MCCTALHFRANSKHFISPPQTHLPPPSTASRTHTHPPYSLTDLELTSFAGFSLSLLPSIFHSSAWCPSQGSSFVLWTRCREVLVDWGGGSCYKGHMCHRENDVHRVGSQVVFHAKLTIKLLLFSFFYIFRLSLNSSTAQVEWSKKQSSSFFSHLRGLESCRNCCKFFVRIEKFKL